MNPFLNKPLKKVQGPPQLKNSSQEHRPSKYLNPPKMPKAQNAEKKTEAQKNRNPSPRDKNQRTNNINIINRFNDSDCQGESSDKNLVQIKKGKKTNYNADDNTKIFNPSSLAIDQNINMTISFDSGKLYFNNNDEILEYIKKKIKEGAIKNVIQKLELKKNDFTGFTLSKKNLGHTIYEIELEEDLEKINESIKKQKVEIKNKLIEIRYAGGPSASSATSAASTSNPFKKEKEKEKEKDRDLEEKKHLNTLPNKPENLLQEMKMRTMERGVKLENKRNEKVNNEIKSLQNKIQKRKEELKNTEPEKDFILKRDNEKKGTIKGQRENASVDARRPSGIRKNMPVNNIKKEEDTSDAKEPEKKKTTEESQKKMSRAYVRFKKAFSSQKEEDGGGEKKNQNKIQSLAEILKEHIIKPLAEIQEECDISKPRAGSVGVRAIRVDRGEKIEKTEAQGVAEIIQNIPVQKKNVKKPKISAFVQ